MLMILKIKFAFVKIKARMEIFDANVLVQLVIEKNSIVIMSAETTMAC